jgi:anti-sigma regulatory factor (Ser/Thr protein kinase)
MGKGNTLVVPARYDQIQVICEFVSAGARQAGLNADTVFHIELCCDEASSNIIEHAYGAEGKGDITASYAVSSDEFRIILHDAGQSFNPEDIPAPQLPNYDTNSKDAALGDIMNSLKVGGLGIHFIRQLMDEVHYTFNGKEGNTLVLVKKINQGSTQ